MPTDPPDATFPQTHWTLIAAAAGPQRESALSRLYRTYWAPICAQARRFGVAADDVEDVAQELFAHLFHNGSVERADPARGRFRSYLLGALRNQLSHRRAREHALKRGGGQPSLPLEASPAAVETIDEREFDAAWARTLVGEALRRFQTEEQHSEESRASFAVLSDVVLGDAEFSCEAKARQLGITVPAVKSRVFRLRRRFHEIMRQEVMRTVSSETECDDELRYLSEVLAKVDGVPELR
jgi:RNA polymerase sigma-70 factor (ECF subfamily)